MIRNWNTVATVAKLIKTLRKQAQLYKIFGKTAKAKAKEKQARKWEKLLGDFADMCA